MLIVILGDTHIPSRAERIPGPIIEKINELEPDRILFTGDVNEYSVLFFLETIAPVYAVRGNTDYLTLPRFLSLEFEGRKVMLIHGHQFGRGNYSALINFAKGHDILVCGHTHRQETFKERGMIVINPGSATGAQSGSGIKPRPSFTVLELEGEKIKIEEYVLGDSHGLQNKRIQIQDEEETEEGS